MGVALEGAEVPVRCLTRINVPKEALPVVTNDLVVDLGLLFEGEAAAGPLAGPVTLADARGAPGVGVVDGSLDRPPGA